MFVIRQNTQLICYLTDYYTFFGLDDKTSSYLNIHKPVFSEKMGANACLSRLMREGMNYSIVFFLLMGKYNL